MGRKPASETVSRREILIATARILSSKGYEATTMRDIAAEVNMTAASLYHHFKGKEFLLLSSLELGYSVLLARLESVAQLEGTPSEKLAAMIRSNVISITDDTRISSTMAFEFRSVVFALESRRRLNDEDSVDFRTRCLRLMAMRDRYDGMFREVLLAGITTGEFRPLDVPIVVRILLGSHNWMCLWYKPGGRLSAGEIADMLVDFWLGAVMAQPDDSPAE